MKQIHNENSCCYKANHLVFLTSFVAAVISAETMELHHSKHHNTYVTNLNVALEKLDAAVTAGDVSSIIALQGALKFNGGGHLNHTLFWENLAPSGELKDGPLKNLIMECYGDFDVMKEDMNANTIAVQGSGWGWLGYNPVSGRFIYCVDHSCHRLCVHRSAHSCLLVRIGWY